MNYLKMMMAVTDLSFSVNNVSQLHEIDLDLLKVYCELFYALSFRPTVFLSLYQ
jgi:hypothetical protein